MSDDNFRPPPEYGDPGFNPWQETREDNIRVDDQYGLMTDFLMEPHLGHYGYGERLNHINKNLILTNLSRKHGESDEAKRFIQSITILKRFLKHRSIAVPTGKYEQVGENENALLVREIFVQGQEEYYRFNNLVHIFSGDLFGITSVAAGTNGQFFKDAKTNTIRKEQTIEDRTETKQTWFAKKNKQEDR